VDQPPSTAPSTTPSDLPGGLVVAIDGGAGTGKSTTAGGVAAALGVPHVDTGAFYRAVTLAALREEVDPADGPGCTTVARQSHVERRDGRTLLDGHDVEDEVRGPEVTAAVAAVSAHEGVRAAVTPLLRAQAYGEGGVVEGRDIGTVVLPDADVKVWLVADPEVRARRRAAERGEDPDAVLAGLLARDEADSGRDHAPLERAEDAFEVDTSELDPQAVVDAVVARVREVVAPATDPVAARRSLPRVAVVGRPNVGKSTLVNRILGRRVAIVEEKPGVTRDRTEHPADWLGQPFVLVDTGGWEHRAEGMAAAIVEQAETAVASADLVLFVVDVTVGVLDDDERYAKVLRRAGVPAVVVANKVDSDLRLPDTHELHRLGLGEPFAVSARHGRGVGDLLDHALDLLPDAPATLADEDPVPRVAIVGKPNVGKSSLFNRLLGEDRSIVDSVAHTTRDAVDTLVEVDGEPWVFVDTAGMRRRYRSGEDTELFSVDRTRAAIEGADLVLFVLDASEDLGEQDQRLAAMLRDAGCGLVLVCNKWDLVDEDQRFEFERQLDRLLSFARFAPRINVSAMSGRGIRRVLPALREVWADYTRRVPSGELNRWLAEAVERTPPPTRSGRTVRVKYVTQVDSRPPVFVAFSNGEVPPAYRRYLERELRARYGFVGVPLRLLDRIPDEHRARERRRRR
jgi:GTP-binding protein